MTRLILRLLNTPVLVLLSMIGIALQTSLFSSYSFAPFVYLQPDVVLIVVIWCALKRGFGEGGIVTLILADFAELHSAAPQGLYLITYMAIYLVVRVLSKVLVLPRKSSLILMTLFTSLLWKILGLGVLHFMGVSGNQWRHTFEFIFPGAVVEGLLAIWAYQWLEKFDWVTFKNNRAEQALEGELQLDTGNF